MNIGEILYECPSYTKLYSSIFGELSLLSVQLAFNYPICCRVVRSGNIADFTKKGKMNPTDAEPTLFPSKDQRDWSKFVVSGQEAKHQFKPFDKVLVRDSDHSKWECDIFSHFGDEEGIFVCISDWWRQCIPYEGNEHLLGTTIK